jgi:hypothetical protein
VHWCESESHNRVAQSVNGLGVSATVLPKDGFGVTVLESYVNFIDLVVFVICSEYIVNNQHYL